MLHDVYKLKFWSILYKSAGVNLLNATFPFLPMLEQMNTSVDISANSNVRIMH